MDMSSGRTVRMLNYQAGGQEEEEIYGCCEEEHQVITYFHVLLKDTIVCLKVQVHIMTSQ